MSSRRNAFVGLAAGGLVALSIPPWGWWPLAFVGVAVLARATDGAPRRTRWWRGMAFGIGMFAPGLWWMNDFHAVGTVFVVLLQAAFVAAAVAVAPRATALPAALVLAEVVRSTVPFGGLPMAGIALGQVDGPLASAARVGGQFLLVWLVALVAARPRMAGLGIAAAITAFGAVAPDGGGPTGTLDVAIVQGGGPRGFRAVDTDPSEVFDAHLAASEQVRTPVDLVLWPEDVVDLTDRVERTPEGEVLAGLADRLDTTLVAGVIEDVGRTRFRNAAVAWAPDGRLVDRYEKVHRVPFGEYIPARGLIKRVADLSVIPRDAIPGTEAGRLDTPAGRLGVVISFEVFFSARARKAVNAGGRLLLVPTNAASFATSQVPTTEVAAARLRAIETGRDLVQAAPTGYGAVVDNRGRVRARTTLGRRQVVHRTVALRDGRTLYARVGDFPVGLAAAVALGLALRRKARAVSEN